jgi:hypothetical protein
MGGRVLGLTDSGLTQVAGFCVQGNEPSDSIKCGGVLDKLRNY